MMDERIEKALYMRYEEADPLRNLYRAWERLPACELMAVIGTAIQEIQYYRQKYGCELPSPPITLPDPTLPNVNLHTMGRAK
jgi:hypothetical protein